MTKASIRRADLVTWIASREVKPLQGVEDADVERRMARLARTKPNPSGPTSKRTPGTRPGALTARPRASRRLLGP
jgi:hypothetical protein